MFDKGSLSAFWLNFGDGLERTGVHRIMVLKVGVSANSAKFGNVLPLFLAIDMGQ